MKELLFLLAITVLSNAVVLAQESVNLNGPQEFMKIIEKKSAELGLTTEFDKKRALGTWQVVLSAAQNSERKIPLWDRLNPKETALVVVDMQNAFVAEDAPIEIAGGRKLIGKINYLSKLIRRSGGKVIWLQYSVENDDEYLKQFESKSYLDPKRTSPLEAYVPGHPMFNIYPELKVEKDDIKVHKNRYSAFFSTLHPTLKEVLNTYGLKNAIVAGVSTDVCAGGTAEGLAQSGIRVVIAWDAVAALDRLIGHEGYLARFWLLYGEVMTSRQISEFLK